MKNIKINLFLVAAMLIGIATMSFKMSSQSDEKLEDLKWFKILEEVEVDVDDPITAADAEYIVGADGPMPPAGTGCNTGGNQCISGFREDQVTPSNEIDGLQLRQQIGHTKN